MSDKFFQKALVSTVRDLFLECETLLAKDEIQEAGKKYKSLVKHFAQITRGRGLGLTPHARMAKILSVDEDRFRHVREHVKSNPSKPTVH